MRNVIQILAVVITGIVNESMAIPFETKLGSSYRNSNEIPRYRNIPEGVWKRFKLLDKISGQMHMGKMLSKSKKDITKNTNPALARFKRSNRDNTEGLLRSKNIKADTIRSMNIVSKNILADKINGDKIIAENVFVSKNIRNKMSKTRQESEEDKKSTKRPTKELKPSPSQKTKGRKPDRKREGPSPDRQGKNPTIDRKTQGPIPDRRTKGPTSDRKTKGPTQERRTKAPSPAQKNKRPTTDRKTTGPSPDREIKGPTQNRKTKGPTTDLKRNGPSLERRTIGPSPDRKIKGPTQNRKTKGPTTDLKRKKPSLERRTKGLSPVQKTRGPTTDRKTKRPSPDRERKGPTPDRRSKGPSPDRETKGPTPDRKNIKPLPEQKRKRPTHTLKTKEPSPDRERKGSKSPYSKPTRTNRGPHRESQKDKDTINPIDAVILINTHSNDERPKLSDFIHGNHPKIAGLEFIRDRTKKTELHQGKPEYKKYGLEISMFPGKPREYPNGQFLRRKIQGKDLKSLFPDGPPQMAEMTEHEIKKEKIVKNGDNADRKDDYTKSSGDGVIKAKTIKSSNIDADSTVAKRIKADYIRSKYIDARLIDVHPEEGSKGIKETEKPKLANFESSFPMFTVKRIPKQNILQKLPLSYDTFFSSKFHGQTGKTPERHFDLPDHDPFAANFIKDNSSLNGLI